MKNRTIILILPIYLLLASCSFFNVKNVFSNIDRSFFENKWKIAYVSINNSLCFWDANNKEVNEIYKADKFEDIMFPVFCFENKKLLFLKNKVTKNLGEIILFNIEEKKESIIYQQAKSIRSLSLSPNEKFIAFLSDYDLDSRTCLLYILELETKTIEKPISTRVKGVGRLYCLSWSPDSQYLAFSDYDGRINLIDINTKKIDILAEGYNPQLSSDGKMLLCIRKNLINSSIPTIYDLNSSREDKIYISRVINAIWTPSNEYVIIVRNDSNIFKYKDLSEYHCEVIAYDIKTKEKISLFNYKGYCDISCK